jgi:hypothetical protein
MYCEIHIKGQLADDWSDWFGELTLTNLENGEAMLHGELHDQAALMGVLNRIHAMNLELLHLHRRDEP